MARPTALLLSPESPYPLDGGGAYRSASVLHYLAGRYDVDLITFRQPSAPSREVGLPPALVRCVHTVDLPPHSSATPARAARNLWRALCEVPPLNDRFAGFAVPIGAILRGRRYDLGIVEHFWCAPYHDLLASHCRRLVLNLHNVESELYERYAAIESWPLSLLHRRFAHGAARLERRWFPRFDLLLAPSEEDAKRIQGVAPGSVVHVYPNALPDVAMPQAAKEHAIIFSGNFDYAPNRTAVKFFRERIWPVLRARHTNLTWRLLGKNPAAVKPYLRNDSQIEVVGPVADAIFHLARAKVSVVPLLSGSGTRFKILEAWAAGVPVVSTTLGAEGLTARHGEHLLLADDPDGFADAVSSLLASEEWLRKLTEAGRAIFKARFTWDSAWLTLSNLGI